MANQEKMVQLFVEWYDNLSEDEKLLCRRDTRQVQTSFGRAMMRVKSRVPAPKRNKIETSRQPSGFRQRPTASGPRGALPMGGSRVIFPDGSGSGGGAGGNMKPGATRVKIPGKGELYRESAASKYVETKGEEVVTADNASDLKEPIKPGESRVTIPDENPVNQTP